MLIAITGGPATGKSTFHQVLGEMRPFVSYDSDRAVHEMLAADPEVIAAVTSAFGLAVVDEAGRIDRARLRTIAFATTQARQHLESILHPRVRSQWTALLEDCRRRGSDFLAEIPLLFETRSEPAFDCTVVVACAEGKQRERLAGRGLPEDMIGRLLASQLPIPEKAARADKVVWNDGGTSSLRRQAALLLGDLFQTTTR